MTPKQLQEAESRYRRDSQRAETSRKARNALVLAAIDEGFSHAAIAAATSLTRGRIGQIAQERERDAYYTNNPSSGAV